MQELQELATSSRTFGADPDYVFLGGGNTSFKTAETLHIKPSGVTLAAIQPADFVPMSRPAIRRLYQADLPADVWQREAAVKEMMAAAVLPPATGRPSVEAPLHELLPYRFVVHLHPTLVNGMTCASDGAAVCAKLFPAALWVPYIDPGATLALAIQRQFAKLTAPPPKVVFLQNHGVFVAADTVPEVEALYADLMARLADAYAAAGVPTELPAGQLDQAAVAADLPAWRGALGTPQRLPILTAAAPFPVCDGPLTPDHLVYAKAFPCPTAAGPAAAAEFQARHGYLPRLLDFPDRAVVGVGDSPKAAAGVLVAARDAARVRQLTSAFGGPRFLADRERQFIENWEVESYRQQVAGGNATGCRLPGKVCIVTGGAQGFGLGIAEGLAAEGATVAVADLNLAAAAAAADDLAQRFGDGAAFAVAVNIADDESVAAMVREVVAARGGVDLLVANAGVLKAGSVKSMSLRDWQFVTEVNYTGYFLCVKHVAQAMAAQNAAGHGPWTDIVQVNSKSGLQGSNRNGAYAGSKFGTIGLTQSFALELVEDRIKVNSVCPGNFFDGPLWSDPEKGLFVQYLQSGKVPGAKTVAEVKRFYEAKVPMGRGCFPADVVKAILYLVDQQYETGQALPITGGQVMLK